jgi:hypothetical protein
VWQPLGFLGGKLDYSSDPVRARRRLAAKRATPASIKTFILALPKGILVQQQETLFPGKSPRNRFQ